MCPLYSGGLPHRAQCPNGNSAVFAFHLPNLAKVPKVPKIIVFSGGWGRGSCGGALRGTQGQTANIVLNVADSPNLAKVPKISGFSGGGGGSLVVVRSAAHKGGPAGPSGGAGNICLTTRCRDIILLRGNPDVAVGRIRKMRVPQASRPESEALNGEAGEIDMVPRNCRKPYPGRPKDWRKAK